MKIRNGFVSNSSSSSFVITNKSDKDLTLVDFVKENPQIIEWFVGNFEWHKNDFHYTQENLLESAEKNNKTLKVGENPCSFGDEDGTLIGEVFDYSLRDGGNSQNFEWKMTSCRGCSAEELFLEKLELEKLFSEEDEAEDEGEKI